MKSWLPIAGVVVVVGLGVFLNSDWGRAQVAGWFGASDTPASRRGLTLTTPPGTTPSAGSTAVSGQGLVGNSGIPVTGGGTGLVPATRSIASKLQLFPSTGQFVVLVALDGKIGRGLSIDPVRKVLMDSGVVQKIAADLNRTFVLPRNIPVNLQSCGEPDVNYDRGTQRITICDEWIAKQMALRQGDVTGPRFEREVVFAGGFAFAHEVGHAFIDQYRLTVRDNEEDVADELAVYLLVGTEFGDKVAAAGADTLIRYAAVKAANPGAFSGGLQARSDPHSPDATRSMNILCWAYGSDSPRFAQFAPVLPPTRDCRSEFAAVVSMADGWLRPHLR